MKKKLLFVHPTMRFGGAEKSLQTLLEVIDYDRYDADLFLLRPEGELLALLDRHVRVLPQTEDAQIFQQPLANACGQYLRRGKLSLCAARLRFSEAVRGELPMRRLEQRGWKYQKKAFCPLAEEYDAAVAYLEGSPIYFCADLVRAKRRIAVIHNDYRALQLDKGFDEKYLRAFDAIVTVSDACADVLREEFPAFRDKIRVIENIISPRALRARSAEDVPFDPDYQGLRVLTMGRLDRQKGLDIAIEACARLADSVDFRWYVLGDGPQRGELEALIASRGLRDRFFLLGTTLNPYPYLARCDVYAQPSRFEGKSIALEEAKCLARPILTTAFSTVRDQIEDGVTGSIAQIDADDVAEKLRALLLEPALRQKLTDNLRGYPGNEREMEKWTALW